MKEKDKDKDRQTRGKKEKHKKKQHKRMSQRNHKRMPSEETNELKKDTSALANVSQFSRFACKHLLSVPLLFQMFTPLLFAIFCLFR